MKALRALGLAVVVALAVLGFVVFAARFSDGSLGPFPGGPLEAGEWVAGPEPDWSFLADVDTVEFQLLSPPRSRTTWILVREGRIYIPCGFPEFRLWKRWPHEALVDGRAVLRVGDRKYRRLAVREEDPAVTAELAARLREKYGVESATDASSDEVWYFRLDPRHGT